MAMLRPCERSAAGSVACQADALAVLLEQQDAQLQAVFETTTAALAHLDRDFRFIRVNQNYARADGHERQWYVGKNHFDLFPNAENQRIFEQVRASKRPYTVVAKPFEYARNPERGVSHWDWSLSPIVDDADEVVGFMFMLVDVSERVRAIEILQEQERRLEQQLAEKEVLLREVHHRVKNNLQIVSSLLYLQSMQHGDTELVRRLDKSRDRIRAMSLVHEVLHDAENLAQVSFAAYVRRLVAAIAAAHQRDEPRVQVIVEVELEALLIDIDLVVPCGLILGELLSNAFEHAFVGRTHGCIRVQVCAASDGACGFAVSDDGVGLPDTVRGGEGGLGLSLVDTLTQQIEGRLEVAELAPGTRVLVELPPHTRR